MLRLSIPSFLTIEAFSLMCVRIKDNTVKMLGVSDTSENHKNHFKIFSATPENYRIFF